MCTSWYRAFHSSSRSFGHRELHDDNRPQPHHRSPVEMANSGTMPTPDSASGIRRAARRRPRPDRGPDPGASFATWRAAGLIALADKGCTGTRGSVRTPYCGRGRSPSHKDANRAPFPVPPPRANAPTPSSRPGASCAKLRCWPLARRAGRQSYPRPSNPRDHRTKSSLYAGPTRYQDGACKTHVSPIRHGRKLGKPAALPNPARVSGMVWRWLRFRAGCHGDQPGRITGRYLVCPAFSGRVGVAGGISTVWPAVTGNLPGRWPGQQGWWRRSSSAGAAHTEVPSAATRDALKKLGQ
jgi:hypothetical protein